MNKIITKKKGKKKMAKITMMSGIASISGRVGNCCFRTDHNDVRDCVHIGARGELLLQDDEGDREGVHAPSQRQ